MSGKNITIMLVPHSNERARRITISKSIIYSFVGLVSFFIVAFFFLAYRNIQSVLNEINNERLVEENRILLGDYQKVSADITQLRQTLGVLAKSDNQIRVATDLPLVDEQTRQMGIGGPDLETANPVKSVREKYGVEDLRGDIDALILQAQFQQQSFDDILSKVEKDHEVWNHTPSIIPIETYVITSEFGLRRHPLTGRIQPHKGVDFSASIGTPIYSSADGVVVFNGRKSGFGLVVIIDHGYGYKTAYAHSSLILVEEGQKVKRGDMIARVGNTGRSTGPHLHYEVWVNGEEDNPMKYIINDTIAGM